MRKLLKASTRALICSTDSMVLESTSVDDRLQSTLSSNLVLEEVTDEGIPGQYIVNEYEVNDYEYQTLIHNVFNDKVRIEVTPFAQLIDFPEGFKPEQDKFVAFDNDELESLERLGTSIAKRMNGTTQEALALSDNNFFDALAMGISIYSWLGGSTLASRQDFDSLLNDVGSGKIILDRVTESSIPKGDYVFDFRILWAQERWRAAVKHDEGYVYFNSNPVVGNQYHKLSQSRQTFIWPNPSVSAIVTLSLGNSKTSGNNSKSKKTSSKKDEGDSPVEEMEM